MLINLTPIQMRELKYSETEMGRIEEVVLTLFLEQMHPYWFAIADTDVLLRGYAMLYNTEKGEQSKATIDIDKLFVMLNKIKNKKYRPTETEVAHACNVLGLSFEKTMFYFISRRFETVNKYLDNPTPFLYETPRMENLRFFLTWIYQKFQTWLGTFVPFMYTADYVPKHVLMDQAPVGLTEAERNAWYRETKRKMMKNQAKLHLDLARKTKRNIRRNKNQT